MLKLYLSLKALILIGQLIRLGHQAIIPVRKDFDFIEKQYLKIPGSKVQNLDYKLIKSIKHYLMGLRITNLWFSTLRGYPCSEREIMAGRCLGAMTPLFDSLFDDKTLTANNIRDAISSRIPLQDTESVIVTLLRSFRDDLLGNIQNKPLVEEKLEGVIKIQMDSLQQQQPHVSDEEIRRITFEKGGGSLMLCRSIMDHPLAENEEEMVLHLGALVQLVNDIFDVREDGQKGIKTMVDGIPDFTSLKTEFQGLIIAFLQKTEYMHYKKSDKRKFEALVMPVLSRGMVCLDHLERSRLDNNGIFDPLSMSRRQLVCDMEQPSNFLKSLKYSLGFLKS
jgi:hypothetical protein